MAEAEVNHINDAISAPNESLHQELFVGWLSRALSASEWAAVASLNPTHLRELYPQIYTYGPRYNALVAILPSLRLHLQRDLATNDTPLLTQWTSLATRNDEAYEVGYDTLAANADYAYRNTTTHPQNMEQLPGYADVVNTPDFQLWSRAQASFAELALNEAVLVSTFCELYLCRDILANIPEFETAIASFDRFRARWDL